MNFYATFSIPFIVGVVTMFVVLIVKYGSWIFGLSAADRMRIVKGIPSRQTPLAAVSYTHLTLPTILRV